MQDLALGLVEPHEVHSGPLLQLVEVPLDGIPSFWRVCLFVSQHRDDSAGDSDIFTLPFLFLLPPPRDSAWQQGTLNSVLPGTSARLGCGHQPVCGVPSDSP